MSYKIRVVYTKPNAEVAMYTPEANFTNSIDTYFTAGKITEKPVEVVDGLNYTYTMTFDSEVSKTEFYLEDIFEENTESRSTYCSNNSITLSLENDI